jgi:hypothetical protein
MAAKSISDAVSLNDFYIKIKVNGKPTNLLSSNKPYYFPIPNNSEYSIVLGNNGPTKCDVSVELDGIYVGLWRVEANNMLEIERPSGINKKFTFGEVKVNYDTYGKGGEHEFSNGKLKLIFTPEVKKAVNEPSIAIGGEQTSTLTLDRTGNYVPDLNNQQYGSGSTRLGSYSSQTFNTVKPITDIDKAKVTEITARLVVKKI